MLLTYAIFSMFFGLASTNGGTGKTLMERDSSLTVDPSFLTSSLSRRDGKTASLTLNLAGSTHRFVASGARFDYFLDRNNLLGIEYSEGENFSLLGYNQIRAQVFHAKYKRFISNSFYFDAALAYEDASVTSERFLFFDGGSRYASGRFSTLGLGISIGNQWQWQNFTLGCDWIGVYRPVSNDSRLSFAEDATATEIAELSEDLKNFVTQTRMSLLRFYLGASF